MDLAQPSFTNPTDVTNPLFPIKTLDRVLLLGSEGGLPFRTETTLLPDVRIIVVNGHELTTLVSQYVAFVDGAIAEVAIDLYAQADDGSVWYLGEDVFNYEDGVIADMDGTWLAGRDGPAAMIMAANPEVGNVWRPENICGVVFEEVTVKATGLTVAGPTGQVAGAIAVEELHDDGSFEDKLFAPGYGEFSTGSGGNLEAVALAVPIDALPGALPAELGVLAVGAGQIFDAAQVGDWLAASAALASMTTAWSSFSAGTLPPMLAAQMNGAMAGLSTAVGAQASAQARQAALDVALAGLDFQLRHRPRSEIDLALLDHWARQLIVDAAAANDNAVLGDAATLEWIRKRLAADVGAELRLVDEQLAGVRAAANARDLARATAVAARLRQVLAGFRR